MAGHSKWKNIQHRKGAQDARRGKMFTKLAVEITVATRLSGKDPNANPRLRLALNKARSINMPATNIERAIKRGAGELNEDVQFFENVYEGYGPGGVAVLVECLTDNVNRTVGEVRHAFTRGGGNLGTEGSVSWMFRTRGTIMYAKEKIADFESLFTFALDNGAEDIVEEEEAYEIICSPDTFNQLKTALEEHLAGIEMDYAEVARVPENYVALTEEQIESMQKLIDLLEDKDDVQNVYHNADI